MKKTKKVAEDGIFKKEREKLSLGLKKFRAIARKAPIQVRIVTEPRKVCTPFDNYVCLASEAVCSDIFWSAIKGDMLRLRHLVQVERISVHTVADPWMVNTTTCRNTSII